MIRQVDCKHPAGEDDVDGSKGKSEIHGAVVEVSVEYRRRAADKNLRARQTSRGG